MSVGVGAVLIVGAVAVVVRRLPDHVEVLIELAVTDEVRQLMVSSSSPRKMRAIGIKQGMRTTGTEAMALVAADIATIDEVIRNVYVA